MQVHHLINETLNQQKSFFDATYCSILITQGHAEQMATNIMGQANISDDGLKSFKVTVSECKKNCDTIKKIIDTNYDTIKTFFI